LQIGGRSRAGRLLVPEARAVASENIPYPYYYGLLADLPHNTDGVGGIRFRDK
jgi:hypothetical protein